MPFSTQIEGSAREPMKVRLRIQLARAEVGCRRVRFGGGKPQCCTLEHRAFCAQPQGFGEQAFQGRPRAENTPSISTASRKQISSTTWTAWTQAGRTRYDQPKY